MIAANKEKVIKILYFICVNSRSFAVTNRFFRVEGICEEVWSLYNDGWALGETDDGVHVFPFWPAREYAVLCAHQDWEGFEAESNPLDEFILELLPNLKNDGIPRGIFYTPKDKCVIPKMDQILADLHIELIKYE